MKIRLLVLALVPLTSSLPAADAIVDWENTRQTIDGFGGCTAWYAGSYRQSHMDVLYGLDGGIGLSILRHRIDPGAVNSDGTFRSSGVAGEVQATNRALAAAGSHASELKIWASSWSPPAMFKSNNNTEQGGSLNTADYQRYAAFQTAFASYMKGLFPGFIGIAPQNEPGYKTWDSCSWSGDSLFDYTKLLDQTLPPDLALLGNEGTGWDEIFPYVDLIEADPVVSAREIIVAGHWYRGKPRGKITQERYPDRKAWLTEYSYDTTDEPTTDSGRIDSGLSWATDVWTALVENELNAVHHWWLVNFNWDGKAQGLYDGNNAFAPSKRLWTFGNFSKFVRPDWVRLASTNNTPKSNVLFSAFRHPSNGSFVLVYINKNSSARTVTLDLSGFATTSLTPHRTSLTEDLVALPQIPVSSQTLTLDLEGKSVTTFVGTASTPAPTIPIADAGANITVYDADQNGVEPVTLDGSASSGANTFVWKENAATLATSPSATASLPVGPHTLTLTVTSEAGATASDSVLVMVNPPGSVALDHDFRGFAPAVNLPWSATYYQSPDVMQTGWNVGSGLESIYINDTLAVSQSHPSSVETDSTLAVAIAENEYLTLSVSPASGTLNLRNATVSFTVHRDNAGSSAKRYAVLTSIGGFTDGAQVYTNPTDLTTSDTPTTYTFTLPDTADYENLAGPVEFRLYGYVGRYSGKVWALDAFRLDHVPPPAETFASWIADNYPALTGDDALASTDFENDGLSNFLEYVLDLNPTAPDVSPIKAEIVGDVLALSYPRARATVTYTVETSTTLAPDSWTTNGVTQDADTPVGATATATATAPHDATTDARRFLRLNISE